MNKPLMIMLFVASAHGGTACNLVDDEPKPEPEEDTGGAPDEQACIDAGQFLAELDCAPGYTPQLFYDGGGSTVLQIDDPAIALELSLGLLIGVGAEAGADWVGYKVTQNTVCTYGCFIGCHPGQAGCVGPPESGGCLLCAEHIEPQECTEFVSACEPSDPEDDGGLDESGGGEATGGVMDAPYDCRQWHPEKVRQPIAGGAFQVPQALVDQLVIGNAEPLAECDGVRLRQGRDGYWVISKMRSGGLLGALGLRVGDELRGIDDVELDSLDVVGRILGWFVTEDGSPRQLDPNHPGFSLRVRRGGRDLVLGMWVVPATTGNLRGTVR